MLLFKDNFRRKMVGFDYQSVLIGTYFEKKRLFNCLCRLLFSTSEVTGSERENRNTSVHAETRSCPPLY